MVIRPRMVKNFAGAMTDAAKAKLKGEEILVDNETKNFRRAICNKCERNFEGQCMKCLCNIRAATIVATYKCPEGLW